jgi:hypothetical protein
MLPVPLHEKQPIAETLIVMDDVEVYIFHQASELKICPVAEGAYFRKCSEPAIKILIDVNRVEYIKGGATVYYRSSFFNKILIVINIVYRNPLHLKGIGGTNNRMYLMTLPDELLGDILQINALTT